MSHDNGHRLEPHGYRWVDYLVLPSPALFRILKKNLAPVDGCPALEAAGIEDAAAIFGSYATHRPLGARWAQGDHVKDGVEWISYVTSQCVS